MLRIARIWLNVRKLAVLAIGAFVFAHPAVTVQFARAQQQTSKKPALEGTLVFAVSGDGVEASLDPVVMVRGGKLDVPYHGENEKAQSQFAQVYFKPGQTYRLIFGGGQVGTATVTKSDIGCNNIHATANLKTTARIHGQIMALATNSESFGRKPSSRRAPTDEERAFVMKLVRQIYTGKGTSSQELRSLQTTNLTATDLNGDGRSEIIGSFLIAGKNKMRRDLFLIAEPQTTGYKATLANYQFYKLPPEGFDSEILFVDQLDFDGDGIAEVFATQAGFDAYSNLIFKKRNGRWLRVFTIVGDAC